MNDRSVPDFENIQGEILEKWRLLIVAGIATGVVVVGIGSRVAMLLLRYTSPNSIRGRLSDDGFVMGRFTFDGTYNLLVLGAAVGLIGAAAYRWVAPWLLGPKWFRRLTVAAASGVVVGPMLVHDDGIDFHVLEPLWFAIALFVALPALFGWTIGLVVDRLAAAPMPKGWRAWWLPIVLVALFPFAIPIVIITGIVLVAWVPTRRAVEEMGGPPVAIGLGIRGAWLSVALLGLVALVRDVQALA